MRVDAGTLRDSETLLPGLRMTRAESKTHEQRDEKAAFVDEEVDSESERGSEKKKKRAQEGLGQRRVQRTTIRKSDFLPHTIQHYYRITN